MALAISTKHIAYNITFKLYTLVLFQLYYITLSCTRRTGATADGGRIFLVALNVSYSSPHNLLYMFVGLLATAMLARGVGSGIVEWVVAK